MLQVTKDIFITLIGPANSSLGCFVVCFVPVTICAFNKIAQIHSTAVNA